ncbi:MAG: hypothetical protein ACOYON_11850 [Fimbriimonas sp.]
MISTTLTTALVNDVVFQLDNTSNSPMPFILNYSAARYQHVRGSASTPPWSTPFTPLSEDYVTVSYYNANTVLPPHKRIKVAEAYYRETGREEWSGSTVRTRKWEPLSFNYISILTDI